MHGNATNYKAFAPCETRCLKTRRRALVKTIPHKIIFLSEVILIRRAIKIMSGDVKMDTVAETWRRVWGDGQIFSRTKISERRFFSEKFSIFKPKNSDDFFKSSTRFFRFSLSFPDSPYLYSVKCRI